MSALSPPKHRPGRAWLGTRPRSNIAQASRYLGALAVLATGLAHIEQYSVDNDSTVPTIGTPFLLNFIAALVISVGLIAPLRRVTGRHTDVARALLASRRDRSGCPFTRSAIHFREQPAVRLR